mgnify:CR=1 FL=1
MKDQICGLCFGAFRVKLTGIELVQLLHILNLLDEALGGNRAQRLAEFLC